METKKEMTAERFIKISILRDCLKQYSDDISYDGEVNESNIDELYESLLIENDLHWDAESEFRCSGVDTDIECEWSRHYESKSMAAEIDGKWIGWTYWYGGGKHGDPGSIDWMDEAYFLDVKEREEVVTIRHFSKVDQGGEE
jgi:hypothetical protein